MAEQWIVRVEGKEYGPVDLETLREWQSEGHLIATNEVRTEDVTDWKPADTIPGLFPAKTAAGPPEVPQIRRRTFGEIFRQTFRIYGKGFPAFFGLALIVAVPSCAFKICLAYIQTPENGTLKGQSLAASAAAIVAAAIVVAMWPILLAGIQIATAEFDSGRKITLRELLRRAVNFWPRVARLCLVVYGSYFLWSVIPVLAILSLVAAQPSFVMLLLALGILAVQVYMTARLFVNFLFWQQSSVLAGHNAIESLRESRDLARNRTRPNRIDRPLYRGAILVSLWILVISATSVGAELPFMLFRMQGITTVTDAFAFAQSLAAAPPDVLTLVAYVLTSLLHAALRPLLGIAFVLLYFDAKTDAPAAPVPND